MRRPEGFAGGHYGQWNSPEYFILVKNNTWKRDLTRKHDQTKCEDNLQESAVKVPAYLFFGQKSLAPDEPLEIIGGFKTVDSNFLSPRRCMNEKIIPEIDAHMRRKGSVSPEENKVADGQFFLVHGLATCLKLFSGGPWKFDTKESVYLLDVGRTINAHNAVAAELI